MRTLLADILTIDGQIQKTFHILIPRWRLTASLAAAYAHGQTGKPSRNWLAIAVLWAISLTVGPARARWDGGHMQVAAVALADLRRLIVGAPSQAGRRTALFAARTVTKVTALREALCLKYPLLLRSATVSLSACSPRSQVHRWRCPDDAASRQLLFPRRLRTPTAFLQAITL